MHRYGVNVDACGVVRIPRSVSLEVLIQLLVCLPHVASILQSASYVLTSIHHPLPHLAPSFPPPLHPQLFFPSTSPHQILAPKMKMLIHQSLQIRLVMIIAISMHDLGVVL